jgi:ribosomal protein S18 acetylase RimI-like enzyme
MVTIQRAKVEEVQEIKQVLSETWIDTYSPFLTQDTIQKVTTVWHHPERLAAQVQNPDVFFAVAKDETNAILGLVSARRYGEEAVVIDRLYVSPQFQRQGIGSRLLEESMTAFPGRKKALLEVEEQNEKGLSFYRKHGFKEVSRKQESVEAESLMVIVMEKQLS